MTLNLKENGDALGPELDVRETPIPGIFENFFVEDDTLQDIAVAAGWTDITGMSKTFTLERRKKVIIIGSLGGRPGDEAFDFGFNVRINVDTVAKANTVRTYKFDGYAFDDPTKYDIKTSMTATIIPIHTQHVMFLDAGSHTIKLQGSAITDGDTFGVRFDTKRSLAILAF